MTLFVSRPLSLLVSDRQDRWLLWGLRLSAALAGVILLLLLAFVLIEAWPALQHIAFWRFFTDASWHPHEYADQGQFNLWPMLLGSVLVSAGAILLAGPVGLATALCLQYYLTPGWAGALRRLVELLAGIPSVVYGFWALVVLVPILRQWSPPGQSLLAGILILALMIVPTVALMTDAALSGLPRALRQNAEALGLSRWTMIRRLLLPAARSGVVAGMILAVGRALGETMAVLMVTGNVVQLPQSWFQPVRALTSNIALEMGYALGDQRSALFVSGLLLILMVWVLVMLAARWGREVRS